MLSQGLARLTSVDEVISDRPAVESLSSILNKVLTVPTEEISTDIAEKQQPGYFEVIKLIRKRI